jgi:mono/diheme cytochrome c family protein
MRMRLLAVAAISAAALLGTSTMLQAQGAMRSIWDGVYTSAQADKGKALFGDNCAKCHGGTLDGNDEIPALKGSHFMADWESQTVADLINRVHTTMPMDDPGKLNTESATSVVAYLLQQNQMPAGSTELNELTSSHARIDAVKPGN